jgi:glycosyltransferase involved in cell wall biosynthesis
VNKILIASPCGTHPPTEGNRARILALAESLQDMGHEVHLALLPNRHFDIGDMDQMRHYWGNRLHRLYSLDAWDLGYRLRRLTARLAAPLVRRLHGAPPPDEAIPDLDRHYAEWWDMQLLALQRRNRFDTVFVEYVFFSQALTCFGSGVRKILDTHDIFTDRTERIAQAVASQGAWLSTDKTSESKGLSRADVVLAIQAEEARTLAEMTDSIVEVVGHTLPATQSGEATASKRQKRLLFVGSSNNINVHGCQWFLEAVFPGVLTAVPDAELRIVGDVGKKLSLRASDRNVVVAGRVDDLANEYAACMLVINPVRFGTGLAIKSVEALAHGRPLVCTSAGARGLLGAELAGDACVATDDPAEMSQFIVQLLEDQDILQHRTAEAALFRERWNTKQLDALARSLPGSGSAPSR